MSRASSMDFGNNKPRTSGSRTDSAGILDSAPTLHGIRQAQLLGRYWARNDTRLTHIFSSKLQRAVKTADLIRQAQPPLALPDIKHVEELREQNMGHREGKPFSSRQPHQRGISKKDHTSKHKDDVELEPLESRESMARRANVFLDECLHPVLREYRHAGGARVVIVSHGIFLGTLWRSILARQLPGSVSLDPELASHSHISFEYLGGWSNTGYLEVQIRERMSHRLSETCSMSVEPPIIHDKSSSTTVDVFISPADGTPSDKAGSALDLSHFARPESSDVTNLHGTSSDVSSFRLLIKAINSKEHLAGIKRARGVGSSAYDESQCSITSYFRKKQKTGFQTKSKSEKLDFDGSITSKNPCP